MYMRVRLDMRRGALRQMNVFLMSSKCSPVKGLRFIQNSIPRARIHPNRKTKLINQNPFATFFFIFGPLYLSFYPSDIIKNSFRPNQAKRTNGEKKVPIRNRLRDNTHRTVEKSDN